MISNVSHFEQKKTLRRNYSGALYISQSGVTSLGGASVDVLFDNKNWSKRVVFSKSIKATTGTLERFSVFKKTTFRG